MNEGSASKDRQWRNMGRTELRGGNAIEDADSIIKYCIGCTTQLAVEAQFPGRLVSSGLCDIHFQELNPPPRI